jgi:16S rRNA (guanine527-N7)-methyltransferase
MQTILSHFSDLSPEQIHQFEQLDGLYREWNEKINVISRKDIDNLYTNHILHALAFAKIQPAGFKPGAQILDIGTGGGFPGIPLAILYPQAQFTLVDSIRKKITVVDDIIQTLGLKNAQAVWGRAEELRVGFDFVVTRAVSSILDLCRWSEHLIVEKQIHAQPNGIWAWKGLDNIQAELKELPRGIYSEVYPLAKHFKEEFFETKGLVYIQM